MDRLCAIGRDDPADKIGGDALDEGTALRDVRRGSWLPHIASLEGRTTGQATDSLNDPSKCLLVMDPDHRTLHLQLIKSGRNLRGQVARRPGPVADSPRVGGEFSTRPSGLSPHLVQEPQVDESQLKRICEERSGRQADQRKKRRDARPERRARDEEDQAAGEPEPARQRQERLESPTGHGATHDGINSAGEGKVGTSTPQLGLIKKDGSEG